MLSHDKKAFALKKIFNDWRHQAERKANANVLALRTDDGTEYVAEMRLILKDTGVVYETTAPHHHEANWIAEQISQ